MKATDTHGPEGKISCRRSVMTRLLARTLSHLSQQSRLGGIRTVWLPRPLQRGCQANGMYPYLAGGPGSGGLDSTPLGFAKSRVLL